MKRLIERFLLLLLPTFIQEKSETENRTRKPKNQLIDLILSEPKKICGFGSTI